MQKFSILILFGFGLFIMACQSNANSSSSSSDTGVRRKTASGYEYINHTNNAGVTPQEGDEVAYYQAVYKNDSLLFSSFENGTPRTAIIPNASRIPNPAPPDYEALMTMHAGDSVTVFQSLDTVKNLPPNFASTDKIIYQIKLVSIKTKEDVARDKLKYKAQEKEIAAQIEQTIKDYNAGKLNGKLKTTASGIKYIVHKEGTGQQAVKGDYVKVFYYGATLDGKEFDNAYKKGQAFGFPLGGGSVIKGWDEGVALMKEGEQATFFIPYQLAYGEAGRPPKIPAKAELVFFIDLQQVIKIKQ